MLKDYEFELILEAFKVQPFKKKSKNLYTFNINGKPYFVTFDVINLDFDVPTKTFEARFSRQKSRSSKDSVQYGINTDDVDATDVYWTVAEIIRQHFESSKSLAAMGYQQIAYYFNAARSEKDQSDIPQRASVVKKIVKRYLSSNDIEPVSIKHGEADQLIVLKI